MSRHSPLHGEDSHSAGRILDPQCALNHWQIGALIAKGYSNKEIAIRLGLSIAAVKKHRTKLMLKLRKVADDLPRKPSMTTKGDTRPLSGMATKSDTDPVIIKRVVRPADVMTEKEREAVLLQLHLAISWARNFKKLPPKLLKELSAFEKRENVTWEENLIPSKVRAARRAGYPLSTSETSKKSAFAVVAEELGMQTKTLKEHYYRIMRATRGGGLSILANTPKPRRPPSR